MTAQWTKTKFRKAPPPSGDGTAASANAADTFGRLAVSQLADLVVEGSEGTISRPAALRWLMDTNTGGALVQRLTRQKRAEEAATRKAALRRDLARIFGKNIGDEDEDPTGDTDGDTIGDNADEEAEREESQAERLAREDAEGDDEVGFELRRKGFVMPTREQILKGHVKSAGGLEGYAKRILRDGFSDAEPAMRRLGPLGQRNDLGACSGLCVGPGRTARHWRGRDQLGAGDGRSDLKMAEVLWLGDIRFPDVTPEFIAAGHEQVVVNDEGDVQQTGLLKPARITWSGKLTDSAVAVARNLDQHKQSGAVLKLTFTDGRRHDVIIADFERLSSKPWIEPHRGMSFVEINYRITVYYADTKAKDAIP